MNNTFKFPERKRWGPLVLSPPCVLVAYGFINEAIPIDSVVSSALCAMVAVFFLAIPIVLLNHSRTIVITSDRGLLIKALFRTTFIPWEEITEYAKHRKLVLLGGWWCYYVTRGSDGRRIKIGFEEFERMHVLNNIIVKKAVGAKLHNTSYEEKSRP
jgi:hypothetical protein